MYQNLELIDISGPKWRCLALHDCLADGVLWYQKWWQDVAGSP